MAVPTVVWLEGRLHDAVYVALRPDDTVMALIVARDLPVGTVLSDEDLVAIEVPVRFAWGELFLTPSGAVGLQARERVLTNELLRPQRLGSPCPDGWSVDGERLGRLQTHAWAGVPVCFGTTDELGMRTDEGVLLLDATAPDGLLAARIEHLVRHGPTPDGPDCPDVLLREEADAWHHELARRVELGVEDPGCPVVAALGPTPDLDAVRAWIATSPHPRAEGLRTSFARRCGALPTP
ncbi:MAG: SAF domain-containing protein [Alphaproteobacteria bacterium]|nr:SAF domain-containing protein [Alphaproteobacteria bacterium]